MFTTTSCAQCTTSSLVLNAPTHLRNPLKSFGLIATLRCAKSVKLTTRYFQETPRAFSVRFLAIAFKALSPLLRYRAAKLPGAWPKMKSQEITRKKSVGFLRNISRLSSRLQCRRRFATSRSDIRAFSVCVALIVRGVAPCHQRKQPWKYSK